VSSSRGSKAGTHASGATFGGAGPRSTGEPSCIARASPSKTVQNAPSAFFSIQRRATFVVLERVLLGRGEVTAVRVGVAAHDDEEPGIPERARYDPREARPGDRGRLGRQARDDERAYAEEVSRQEPRHPWSLDHLGPLGRTGEEPREPVGHVPREARRAEHPEHTPLRPTTELPQRDLLVAPRAHDPEPPEHTPRRREAAR
jgi:hypothetical protein